MFFAHLPAGYIISQVTEKKFGATVSSRKIMAMSLVGSIAPDLDLIYFYLISARTMTHHAYLPHIPLFWIIVFLLLLMTNLITYSKERILLSTLFIINVFVHLILDTVVGGVIWLYPFKTEYVSFFVINARYDWWVLNYLLNWTFVFEIGIIAMAGIIYCMGGKN